MKSQENHIYLVVVYASEMQAIYHIPLHFKAILYLFEANVL